MAITGVSDPDRRVCDYSESSSTCFENYKYCSDYRGNNRTFCRNIKPYDELGNNIDIRYKCKYESWYKSYLIPQYNSILIFSIRNWRIELIINRK